MKEIKVLKHKKINKSDWEIENFKEIKIPNEDNDEQILINGIRLYKRILDYNNKFIFSDLSSDLIEVNENINPDEIYLINPPYSDYVYIINEKYLNTLNENIDSFNKLYLAIQDEYKNNNIYNYFDRYKYDIFKTYEENLNELTILKISLAKELKKRAVETGDDELFKKFKTELDSGKIFDYQNIKISKDGIKIDNNFNIIFDEDISTSNNEVLLNIYKYINIQKYNRENLIKYLGNTIKKTNFTLFYEGKKLIYTKVGYKFKIKYNKTHTWSIGSYMHSDLINLDKIKDTFILLEFYENATKPVGEYYTYISVKINDEIEPKIIPVEVKKNQSDNSYNFKISDEINFDVELNLSNIKKDSFNRIKASNFTYSITFSYLYNRLKLKYLNQDALDKLKYLKSILMI